MTKWEKTSIGYAPTGPYAGFSGTATKGQKVDWYVAHNEGGTVRILHITSHSYEEDEYWTLSTWDEDDTHWTFWGESGQTLVARGLYCLGFEDEHVIAEVNCPLSAHEKMELRLLMQREFWPDKWSEEAI